MIKNSFIFESKTNKKRKNFIKKIKKIKGKRKWKKTNCTK